jgi:hypothetical protein
MRPDILIHLAEGRAELVARGKTPPFVAFLLPKRAMKLCRELHEMKIPFGLPLGLPLIEPRDDGNHWIYFGTILCDVHVYGRSR